MYRHYYFFSNAENPRLWDEHKCNLLWIIYQGLLNQIEISSQLLYLLKLLRILDYITQVISHILIQIFCFMWQLICALILQYFLTINLVLYSIACDILWPSQWLSRSLWLDSPLTIVSLCHMAGDVPRVDGQLAVARAFGDKSLKVHLSAKPDINDIEVDDKTELLILASDGLWKVSLSKVTFIPWKKKEDFVGGFW